MTAGFGGSANVLLFCNDLAMGRSLGRACLAHGLPAPAWVVSRLGPGRPVMSFDIVIVIPDPGPVDAEQLERLTRLAAGGPVLVVAARPPGAPGHELEWIAPAAGWEAEVVERLIERLGLTPALLPTYENRLRVLGRELDRRGYSAVSIVETAEGFSVRPEAPDSARLAGFDFTDRDFGRLAREALRSRGEEPWERPTGRLAAAGHELSLRAIGRELDAGGASRVQIVLLAHSLLISGARAASPYDAPEPFQELLRGEHLRDLERGAQHARREPEGWVARLSKKFGLEG